MVLKDSDSNAATLLDLDTEAALPLWFEICFCRLPPKTQHMELESSLSSIEMEL